MKKILVVFALVMALSASMVYANQFDGIIDVINDVFELIGSVFTLPLFSTPQLALGFFLFLLWVMLVSILVIAIKYVPGLSGHQRQQKIIAVIIATMTIVMINFQKEFMWKIIGNFLIWIYFICVFGVVGILVYHAIKPNSQLTHWMKALIYFLALMVTLAAKEDLVVYLDALRSALNDYIFIFPLYYYIKWRQQQT